jgi:hypothetical protein
MMACDNFGNHSIVEFHMQKSLDQMNIRAHHMVLDLSGMTGMAIMRAIVGGERDPKVLAGLREAAHDRAGHNDENVHFRRR